MNRRRFLKHGSLLLPASFAFPAIVIAQPQVTKSSAYLGSTRKAVAGTPTSSPVVTAQTPGSNQSGLDTLEVGFKFVVGGSGITVTDVGRWKALTSSNSHVLTIRLTSTWVSQGSGTIDNTGQPTGDYVWTTLGSPISLSAGTGYFIGSMEAAAGDTYGDSGAITVTAAIGTVVSAYGFGGTGPNNGTANQAFGPVNFKYY